MKLFFPFSWSPVPEPDLDTHVRVPRAVRPRGSRGHLGSLALLPSMARDEKKSNGSREEGGDGMYRKKTTV